MKLFVEIYFEVSIREYIVVLNGKLKVEGIKVKLKEGVLIIYNEGVVMVWGILDVVFIFNIIFKMGKDLK